MQIRSIIKKTCLAITLSCPTFVWALDDAVNLPKDDKILFFMGQDAVELANYKTEVLEKDLSMPKPGGVTLYTSLYIPASGIPQEGQDAPLASLKGRFELLDLVHDMPATLADYPDQALSIGLTLNDSFAGCLNLPIRSIAGVPDEDVAHLIPIYRQYVDEMIHILKDTGREVFLRIGYEVDHPGQCHEQEAFKEAFRYIKKRIVELEADKIATVWQLLASPYDWPLPDNDTYISSAPDHFDRWYPGDDAVDWVGFSHFAGANYRNYGWLSEYESFFHSSPRDMQVRVLEFARLHNKPVMIPEAAPQGYQIDEETISPAGIRIEEFVGAEVIWDNWYLDWFDFIEDNQDVIRAVAYINVDWNSQLFWHCDPGVITGTFWDPNNPDAPFCANGYWGDTRIQGHPYIQSRFKERLENPVYVNGGKGVPMDGKMINEEVALEANEPYSLMTKTPEDGVYLIGLEFDQPISRDMLEAELNGDKIKHTLCFKGYCVLRVGNLQEGSFELSLKTNESVKLINICGVKIRD